MANPRTIARLEGLIKRRAAYCLQFELQDPRAGFITILRVELSKDLSVGKIYFSVLGDEQERSRVQHMLEHAAGFIQRQVGRVLHLRRVPHLRWIYDDTIAEAARLGDLIQEARARDRVINPDLDDSLPVVLEPPSAEELWSRYEEDQAGATGPDLAGEPMDDGTDEPDQPVDAGKG